jgi:hypothetical protein
VVGHSTRSLAISSVMGRTGAIAQVVISVVPFALALAMVVLTPVVSQAPGTWAIAAVVLGASGFVAFTYAKLSVLRRSHLASWGAGEMPSYRRKFYWAGYVLMGVSFLLFIAALASGAGA